MTNSDCMGYAIRALESLEFSVDLIQEVINAMKNEFDITTESEAAETYNSSPY